MKPVRPIITVFMIFLITLQCSCTRTISITAGELRNSKPDLKTGYQIETFDKNRYVFWAYTVSDDTLTMKHPRCLDIHDKEKQQDDVKLAFSDIRSIKKVKVDKTRSLLVAGILIGSFTALCITAYILAPRNGFD